MQFIHSGPLTGKETQHNRHLVRSHVSKLNRQRSKAAKVQQQEANVAPRKPITHESVVAGRKDTDSDASISSQSSFSWQGVQQSLALEIDSSDIDSCKAAKDKDWTNAKSLAMRDLRPLSPFFGGLSAKAFSSTADLSISQSAHYCQYYNFNIFVLFQEPETNVERAVLSIILPNAFLPSQAWFQLFCNEPIVFHGFSSVCNLHLALQDNSGAAEQKQQMLKHRSVVIRLLNERMNNLQNDDIETIMLGIFTMYPEDDEIRQASQARVSLFVPHMPWADDLNIYVGGDPETHRRAIKWLVNRAGGIDRLKLPGLGKATATNDLILASVSCSRPQFSWLWGVEPLYLLDSPPFSFFAGPLQVTGIGFTELSNAITPDAVYCFKSLSCIDKIMAQIHKQKFNDAELALVVTARDTAHHRLLSLPAWERLDDSARSGRVAMTYECCRLASIIYSNRVLFPIFTESPGTLRPVAELRVVLETIKIDGMDSATWNMLVWCSLTGAIASLRTEHRVFFHQQLGDILEKSGITSLHGTLSVARKFIWSDCACEQAVIAVWNSLDLFECE